MKLAVIFIGTNKYLNFLPTWYESCEEFLLPGIEKKYLIFTDGEIPESPDNAIVYHQEHLEWPFITLYRFKTIQKCFNDIQDCDWLLFLDADMRLVDTVSVDDLINNDKKYIGVHHPCHYLGMHPHNKPPGSLETNPDSRACVSESDDISVYFQGCLWGGKIPHVLEMIKELDQRTDEDYNNDVIAVWHDESHLNKFYSERKDEVHILPSEFAYPEVFDGQCDFEAKIVHLAKDNSKYHV